MDEFWSFVVKYWVEIIFTVICTGLSAGYARLKKALKKERAKNQAIENGLKGILRLQIIDTYDKCVSNGRKITITRKDAICDVYKSFAALCEQQNDADDTIKQIYDELIHMPVC